LNADKEAIQHVLGEKMHQLLFLAHLLNGQHIEHVARNTIRYSKPGTEALAVIHVRDHEHDIPTERLDTGFYPPSSDYFQRRDSDGAGLGLAINDRFADVE
jgi:nitrogen-specific signal transduction histidine kinase